MVLCAKDELFRGRCDDSKGRSPRKAHSTKACQSQIEKVDANKQSHFTLGWISSNVSRVAAIAVLANNARDEPDDIDENACLLQHLT